jgi:CO/xanthine dehydrogenase Mo-binding subunit
MLLTVSKLVSAEQAAATAPKQLSLSESHAGSLTRGRIEGVEKVTGAKLYASDFRASDMPGWPGRTSHALLLRSPEASRVYEGLSLDALGPEARPSVVVTAKDILDAGLEVPEFYAGDLFCPAGTVPLYLGQPVAMLLFETFDAYDMARQSLRKGNFLRFGDAAQPKKGANYANLRFVRVAGPGAHDSYSPIQEGWISPEQDGYSGRPLWEPRAGTEDSAYASGAKYGAEIRAELAAPDSARMVLDRAFETQSVDPMFLEPECGLAWYDSDQKSLELVLGVQSPHVAATSIAYLLDKAQPQFRPTQIDARFAYLGGGFGGRGHTPFPLHTAIAALH